ncbi:MAG: 23S rRNA (pseudouridine(1915)-N(3))-methyltransferase RlmH [Burkholderiaceae bacterium]
MKLLLIAVGQRPPAWAQQAYAEFAKRFPPEMRLELKCVKAEPRGGRSSDQVLALEGARIEAACPKSVRRVVVDERGQRLSTTQLATRLQAWAQDARDVALLVGGPDGLSPVLKAGADESLRLSDLTLPHALARVVLAEALYRAWTVTINHPYHRE